MNSTTELYKTAVEIVRHIIENGYVAFFAGGCVRDKIMGNSPSDYDIATNAKPEQIMKMFARTIPIGVSFGVVSVIVNKFQFEVATFRSDGIYSDSRHPDNISFCDNEIGDVSRRDFTINGMLFDPLNNKLLDYVGGESDIKSRQIRTIGNPHEKFKEDSLRMIRGARFAARFLYEIEYNTKLAIKDLAKNILTVSAERIRQEFEKGLTGPNPHTFIKIMDDLNLLDNIMPEVCLMKGVEQPENFHPEGDVFVHTLLTISKLNNPSWELAMGALLHDVAKPNTYCREINPDGTIGRIRFTKHDNIGAKMAGEICKRIKTSTYTKERVMWLVKKHLCVKDLQNMRKSTLKRLFAEPGYKELLELFKVDTLASTKDLTRYEYCKKRYSEMSEEQVKPKPLVNGHDLIEMGLKPGPIFSKILSEVMDEQLEEKISTREEAMDFVKDLTQKNVTE